MAEPRLCPQCGEKLPSEAPEGLCPKCLLTVGLDNSASEQVPMTDTATIVPSEIDPSISPLGTRIHYFGDYELLDEIARGGMGVVYQARQVKLNRIVALKMILAGQLASEEDVKRFHTEAEAAANLQHRNIVAIHEVGQHEGQHYFSMDYVEGQSLAKIVREHPLPVKKAAEYVKTIAEAIHYAHGEGTLHRDLKPSNILIDGSDQPRITDFGLAKRIEGNSKLTASGAVLGTPSYMPPEQATARRGLIGPASDVYSMGALLYELLTGQPPFHAETPLDTLLQVIEQDPVSPRQLNPNIPADLETICLKCLRKGPEARYRTAQELAADLGRFLDHEPIQARPAGTARKMWSWTKRKPWAVTAVASLFVLGLLSLAYWLWVENSYLRFMATHPDYIRKAGSRTERWELVNSLAFFIWPALGCLNLWCQRHSANYSRKGHPISHRRLTAASCLGCVGMLYGVFVATQTINAVVWENHGLFRGFTTTYLCCYFGAVVLVKALSMYEASLFGPTTEPSHLTDDLRDQLSRLFLEEDPSRPWNWWNKRVIAAIKLYRTETGCSLREAHSAVKEFLAELHLQYPDKVPDAFDRALTIFKGSAAVLLSMLAPFLAAGLFSGEPHTLSGLIGLFASISAAAVYRRNRQWLTATQIGIGVLLLAGLGALLVFYPVLPVLLGSMIGIAAGLLFTYFVPQSRLANWGGTSVKWKSRLIKTVSIAAIVGFVSGLIPPAVLFFVYPGKLELAHLYIFLGIPVMMAVVMAVSAAAAIGILRYFHWSSTVDQD